MKEKLTNNLALKIGAVLLAILVWLMVINSDNPITEERVSYIPIQFVNSEVFTHNGKTFQVVGGTSTVSVRVYARRLNISKITKDDFTATVDCNKITDFNGAVKIEVKYTGDSTLLESFEVIDDTIRIETENMLTRELDIEYKLSGSVKSGYAVGDVSLSPNKVTVSAPESVMEDIESVSVTVDVDQADSDISKDVNLVFYDVHGKELTFSDKDRVTISNEVVRIQVPILRTTQVPLDYFSVTGTDAVAEGYRYIGVECDTTSVNLKGYMSAMVGLERIQIPAEELDVTGATGDVVKQIDIRPYLPANVEVVGSKTVTVTLKVEALVDREFSVNKSWIQLNGLLEDTYAYELMPGNTTYRVTVRGLDDDLRSLSANSLEISLDLTGYEAGTYEVIPTIALADGFTVQELEAIEVVITALEDPAATTPDESGESEETTPEVPEESSTASSEEEEEA